MLGFAELNTTFVKLGAGEFEFAVKAVLKAVVGEGATVEPELMASG